MSRDDMRGLGPASGPLPCLGPDARGPGGWVAAVSLLTPKGVLVGFSSHTDPRGPACPALGPRPGSSRGRGFLLFSGAVLAGPEGLGSRQLVQR